MNKAMKWLVLDVGFLVSFVLFVIGVVFHVILLLPALVFGKLAEIASAYLGMVRNLNTVIGRMHRNLKGEKKC
jgi:hypothetical protein